MTLFFSFNNLFIKLDPETNLIQELQICSELINKI